VLISGLLLALPACGSLNNLNPFAKTDTNEISPEQVVSRPVPIPEPQDKANAKNKTGASKSAQEAPKEDKPFPTKTSWILSSFQNKSFGSERPTFILDENFRAKGFGGCNAYSATAYPLRGFGFSVGPIALTKKACDKNLMDLEKAFLVALRTTQKWDLVEGALVLTGSNGTLRFERSF
jgi:heat shock protein HslJ